MFLFSPLAFLAICIFESSCQVVDPKASLEPPPVILIPGIGGSRLESKADPDRLDTKVRIRCPKIASPHWKTLYLDLVYVLPGEIDCILYALRLHYDPTSRRTSSPPGIEIRPTAFGNTTGVESVVPLPIPGTLTPLVDYFVDNGNYVRGKSILGAPYDWRKAPNEMEDFYADLKHLIQSAYYSNGMRPVSLVTHSQGGLHAWIFLTRQSPSWKRKFIKTLIPMSAPIGGSVLAISVLVTGKVPGLTLPYAQEEFKEMLRSFPALFFLVPNSNTFNSRTPLVRVLNDIVTVKNLSWFFQQTDIPFAVDMYHDQKFAVRNLPHPGVNITCIFSRGHDVNSQLVYDRRKDFPNNPTLLNGPGDSFVNLNSLEGCLRWSVNSTFAFSSRFFENIDHEQVQEDMNVIKFVFDTIMSGN